MRIRDDIRLHPTRNIARIEWVDRWMRRVIQLGGYGCLGLLLLIVSFLVLQIIPLFTRFHLKEEVLVTQLPEGVEPLALGTLAQPGEILVLAGQGAFWVRRGSESESAVLRFVPHQAGAVRAWVWDDERLRMSIQTADGGWLSLDATDPPGGWAWRTREERIAPRELPGLRGRQGVDELSDIEDERTREVQMLPVPAESGPLRTFPQVEFDAGGRIVLRGWGQEGLWSHHETNGTWRSQFLLQALPWDVQAGVRWFPDRMSPASFVAVGQTLYLVNLSLDQLLGKIVVGQMPVDVKLNVRHQGLWVLGDDGSVRWYSVRLPPLDFSWQALGGAQRGDGRDGQTWQAAVGHPEIQGRLSLVPLVWGTVWGTGLALIFAVPLALLAAIYSTQMTRSGFVLWARPLIEMVGSIPSVVLGVICAFWIGPHLERNLASWLGVFLLGVVFLVGGFSGRKFFRKWFPSRRDFKGELFLNGILLIAIIVAGISMGPLLTSFFVWITGSTESVDLVTVLERVGGVPYEQRNALGVALVLGFTTTPFLYSLILDALEQVPRGQVEVSVSLGASQLQTIYNIVLPAAAPGVLAAVMIAAGRCLGETMIFVMASGNTPTTGLGLFEGFRTLSASILIELPETAFGSTLYRTLFVAGMALLALTFVVNTFAGLLRIYLHQRQASEGGGRRVG